MERPLHLSTILGVAYIILIKLASTYLIESTELVTTKDKISTSVYFKLQNKISLDLLYKSYTTPVKRQLCIDTEGKIIGSKNTSYRQVENPVKEFKFSIRDSRRCLKSTLFGSMRLTQM